MPKLMRVNYKEMVREAIRRYMADEVGCKVVLDEVAKFKAKQGGPKLVIPADRLLTSHDIGRMLQMDPSSIVKWMNDGILPGYRTPGGHRRIRAGVLLEFLVEHNMAIPEALAK